MLKMLIQSGSFGLVVFVVGWVFARMIPQMDARQEKRDAAFLAALDRQHVEHAQEIKDHREYWDGQIDRLKDAIDRRYVFGPNGKGSGQ